MPEKTIFIRLLEFGEKNGIQGFRGDEYEAWKAEQPDIVNEYSDSSIEVESLLIACFDRYSINSGFKYVLKTEYYFRLIEFKELEESRKASSDANTHSQIAIGFSILAIVASLIVGAIQLNSTVTIDYDQVNRMETKNFPATQKVRSDQLDKVIEALEQSNINTAELARLIEEQNRDEVKESE